jgi:hypothetical protein
MWGSSTDETVTCIACGTEVSRSKAREYDRYGDRWGSRDREFEFLCKPCYRECCHQPRAGLEQTLVAAGAGTTDQETFLAQFHEAVDADGSHEHEPERE